LTVLLLSYAGMCNVPNFEVDAFTSGERYFPDLYDNTVVWWEGGNGGQFVWYDWLAEEEGVFPAASSQPLHSRIYKRFVVWSDEFSADPNIYLADLVPGDTNDVVSLWIDYPEDGDDITNGSVIVHGGTLSLASEITNVAWRLYTGDGEFLDNGVADGTEEWSFALELVPLDAGYDIYVSTTDELGYFNEEEISIFYDTTNELYTVAEVAAVSSQSVTVICDAPGAQINPDIYGQYVVWEDHRNTNSCIYLYDRLSEITTLLTNVPSNQIQPAIYGNTIVWVDYRNGNADIYAYDIASSTVFPLCTNDFDQLKPDVFGNIVVWEDYRNGNANVFALNMSNGVEFVVNESKWPQLVPRVSDSWIVWEDWRSEQGESDIYGYDLSSGTTKMIYSERWIRCPPRFSATELSGWTIRMNSGLSMLVFRWITLSSTMANHSRKLRGLNCPCKRHIPAITGWISKTISPAEVLIMTSSKQVLCGGYRKLTACEQLQLNLSIRTETQAAKLLTPLFLTKIHRAQRKLR